MTTNDPAPMLAGVLGPPKASDFTGRFREIISDPLNLLIRKHPLAGTIDARGQVILHNGLTVPFVGPDAYYGEFSAILALNRGIHEPLEEYVFQEVLKHLPEAPIMVELGAYWAHYSMWLKHDRPHATVIMVEPDQAGLRIGERNFATNVLSGEFINARVAAGEFEVDRFLLERSLGTLSILHADIQGMEVEMLQGCRDALARHAIERLFISTHGDSLHHEVVSVMREAGYRVEVSQDFETETTSFDGFVFASSPTVPPILEGFRPLGRLEIAHASPDAIVQSLKSSMRLPERA